MAPGMLDLREQANERAARLQTFLPPHTHLYEAAIGTWQGRMRNEHGSAHVFASLALQMEAAGFADEEIAEVREFAHEERNHGVLCGAVVQALGGTAVVEALVEEPFPWHPNMPAEEGVLCNLLSVSCLSETIAVALIGAERFEMPAGALHDLLTEIWSDEVGHARFGWRVVTERIPNLPSEGRARLSEYLRVAFAHLEEHELGHLPLTSTPPKEGASLGLCSGKDARELFYATIDTAIIPPLERLGLSARASWETRYRRNKV